MAQSDRWPQLCKLVEIDDGLAVRESGQWTEDKLWFWNSYIDITTRAMVGNPKWQAGLTYVDLFGGAGVCRITTSGKRVPGSPLIAANAPKAFRSILVCEMNPERAAACSTRLSLSPAAMSSRVFVGSCHEMIHEIVKHIPSRSLTLAFIDPDDLSFDFETLQVLAQGRQVDFLLLFADAMDLVRNVETYVKQDQSKLDAMLGSDSDWRSRWNALQNRSAPNVRSMFLEIYKSQIQNKLGYRGFRDRVIEGPKGPLYSIVYASKHERGLEFWDKITKKERTGGLLF